MNPSQDQNLTVDLPSRTADSLEAGLAAGFGRRTEAPRSLLGGSLRPVLLRDADGESAHVVKPKSDAIPLPAQAGDRYQISGEIARGGMGAILRGRDVDLGRDLAIKVLLEQYANRPEVARRFIEEAQIGGQLQHPGVVPVYDIGHFGDRPFFTMKLVKGQTLAAILSHRKDVTMDHPRLLSIALQVAQTLAYAHAKGVIHRDLKPANIMVGSFGEVQVMDWGLAKVLTEGGIADEEQASRQHQPREDVTTIRTARSTGSSDTFGTNTEAGSLLGTPAYMPPEQANGDVALLDRRADVFGLGAILCEILTGKPPYVGRHAEEVRRKASNADLADALLRLESCTTDAELIALTRLCLSPEAADRPQDAQAVADALTSYQNGVQARLHQAELAQAAAKVQASEEIKRSRLTMALAASIIAAIALCTGGWVWIKGDRDSRQAQLTHDVQLALHQALKLQAESSIPDADTAALLSQAREQAQRAHALVDSGPTYGTLKQQVQQLIAELDDREKDRKLLESFEKTYLAGSSKGRESVFDDWEPILRNAFRDYGIPVGESDPASAIATFNTKPEATRRAIVGALDYWIICITDPNWGKSEPQLDWLKTVATGVIAENFSRHIRAALEKTDATQRRDVLEKLAQQVDVSKQSPGDCAQLIHQLNVSGALAAASIFAQKAWEQYPGDFYLNRYRGDMMLLATPKDIHGAVRFLTVAMALRPGNAAVANSLGVALRMARKNEEALVHFRHATMLDPANMLAHRNMGLVLSELGQMDEALKMLRMAVKINPQNNGNHYALGTLLLNLNRPHEAMESLRTAVKLDPAHAAAHCNLGLAFGRIGHYDESLNSLQRGHELGSSNPAWNAPSAQWLEQAKRKAAVAARLPALLKGDSQPNGTVELEVIIDICRTRKQYYSAYRILEQWIGSHAPVAEKFRYEAACLATLAAASQGEDSGQLDHLKRTQLRQKALQTLQSELTRYAGLVRDGSRVERELVHQRLRSWQQDAALAAIRDPSTTATLPDHEQKAITQFWAEVAAILKHSEGQPK